MKQNAGKLSDKSHRTKVINRLRLRLRLSSEKAAAKKLKHKENTVTPLASSFSTRSSKRRILSRRAPYSHVHCSGGADPSACGKHIRKGSWQ
jgi:hypothetical protein